MIKSEKSKIITIKKFFKAVFNPASLISLVVIFFITMLVLNPDIYLKSSLDGITVFAINVLPALLPFFFLTKLLTSMQVLDKFAIKLSPISKFLFGTSGISAYIFLISALCGYPMGSKLVSDFYMAGKISEEEAKKIVTFTSTSGPLFIVGTVGATMMHSKILGLIILASHIIASILNGILFNVFSKIRHKKNKCSNISTFNSNKIEYNKLLSNSMTNTISSVFVVGGFIAIFYLCIDILLRTGALDLFISGGQKLLGFISIPPEFSKGIVTGLIEVTRGCLDLASYTQASPIITTIITSIVISFGGLSVGAQAMFFLKDCNVSFGYYLLQKFTHAILTGFVCFVMCLICL